MGRRKTGRDISGWILVDKPRGIGSTDIVNKLRWLFQAKKAGHSGTLDPAATGLLAIAFGEATKTIPYILEALKAYHFSVRFGQETDTDDAEGQVIAQYDTRPSDREIEQALGAFRGEVLQVPPHYSAVKVDGERAYDLSRSGAKPELKARPLWVEKLDIISRTDPDSASFEMICGKGGYVRAIARDLGRGLGCGAHVSALRRLWSGPFALEQALAWDVFEKAEPGNHLDGALLALEVGLSPLPEFACDGLSAKCLRNGNPSLIVGAEMSDGELVWASHQGRAVAVGRVQGGVLHPRRVFVQP